MRSKGPELEHPQAAPWRCTKTKYCATLLERSGDGDAPRGLIIRNYISTRTLKTALRIAMHKLGAKDRGLVLNFCPWCGFDFSKRKDWPGDRK